MRSRDSGASRLLVFTSYYSFVLLGWNAVLVPSLIRSMEHDLHQSDAAFGLFFFIASLLYAAGSITGGFLTERMGRRTVLAAGSLAIGLGLVGRGLAPTWVGLLATLPLAGWGAGVIDGGVNGLFLDLFREARGGALNLLHLFFSLGALISPFAVGHLVSIGVNWQAIMLLTGVASVVLCVQFGLIDMPSGRHDRHVAQTPEGALTRSERSLLPFFGLAAGICFYVATEIGVSNWLVRFLSGESVTTATGVLSLFWGGLSLGRLLSNWIADRIDYVVFTVGCLVLTAATTIGAALSPVLPLTAVLFALAGLFSGPIFPMIMAIGGNIYPHRLARLSGSLTASAIVGSVAYPPIMGLMAGSLGLQAGMVGAGILAIPGALAVLGASLAAGRAARNHSESVSASVRP